MALFVGLDVSLKTTSICVVEADGSPGLRPDRWDLTGIALRLAGAAVIVAGPR